jgi:hypothetical protein
MRDCPSFVPRVGSDQFVNGSTSIHNNIGSSSLRSKTLLMLASYPELFGGNVCLRALLYLQVFVAFLKLVRSYIAFLMASSWEIFALS